MWGGGGGGVCVCFFFLSFCCCCCCCFASVLSLLGTSHVSSLLTAKTRKGLVRDVLNAFAAHSGLVYDVIDTDSGTYFMALRTVHFRDFQMCKFCLFYVRVWTAFVHLTRERIYTRT